MIATPEALDALIDRARASGVVALDTEFVWERTFFPALGLVQVGLGGDDVHLIDPLAVDLAPLGALTVDEGAARALARGSSLLPAGVRAVTGEFGRGDPVSLVDMRGREVARGLSAYDANSARRIAGRRSDEIEAILGWRGRTEMVHRDDLVLL